MSDYISQTNMLLRLRHFLTYLDVISDVLASFYDDFIDIERGWRDATQVSMILTQQILLGILLKWCQTMFVKRHQTNMLSRLRHFLTYTDMISGVLPSFYKDFIDIERGWRDATQVSMILTQQILHGILLK